MIIDVPQQDLSEAPDPTYGMSLSGAGALYPPVEGEGELAGGPGDGDCLLRELNPANLP